MLPTFGLAAPAGVGELSYLLPAIPSLAGRTIYHQALLMPSPCMRDWRLTNATVDTLVR